VWCPSERDGENDPSSSALSHQLPVTSTKQFVDRPKNPPSLFLLPLPCSPLLSSPFVNNLNNPTQPSFLSSSSSFFFLLTLPSSNTNLNAASSVSHSVASSCSLGSFPSASLTVAILPAVSAMASHCSLRTGWSSIRRMWCRRSAESLEDSASMESREEVGAV